MVAEEARKVGERPSAAAVAAVLGARLPRLYAVLDAARPWGALSWLRGAGLPYQCLFDGQKAVELAEEAPYLVYLGDRRDTLELVTERVWEDFGGIFLESRVPFYEVRRQLRRFLLVQDEDRQVLFFRWYDPRVAAPFLPTLSAKQIRTVFGQAIDAYLYENDDEAALEQATVGDEDGTPVVAISTLMGSN
ncbi:MAG: DUF4123 domain-containing protein [Myxococcales bacterium]|nr:DUF4123 domain-containing protein [Myxococcales bacterium]